MKHEKDLFDRLHIKGVEENRPELLALANELASEMEIDPSNREDRLRECGMVLWRRAEKYKNALKEILKHTDDYLVKHTIKQTLTGEEQ